MKSATAAVACALRDIRCVHEHMAYSLFLSPLSLSLSYICIMSRVKVNKQYHVMCKWPRRWSPSLFLQ